MSWVDRRESNPRTWSHNPVPYHWATANMMGLRPVRIFGPAESRGLEPQALTDPLRLATGFPPVRDLPSMHVEQVGVSIPRTFRLRSGYPASSARTILPARRSGRWRARTPGPCGPAPLSRRAPSREGFIFHEVGTAGFEPANACTQSRWTTGLSHAPKALRQWGSPDVFMGAPAHITVKGVRTPGVNVVQLSFAVVQGGGLEPPR